MTRTDFDEKVVDVTEQKRIARGVVVDSADVSEGIQPSLMAKWDAELEKVSELRPRLRGSYLKVLAYF